MYLLYAFLSAIFASMTAILVKIGLSNINSNLATAIRTIVILIMSWVVVFYVNSYNSINTVEAVKNIDKKTLLYNIIRSSNRVIMAFLF